MTGNLLYQLKRRNVFRMAGLYLVGAWLLVQVASTLFPAFGVPGTALRSLVIVLALGFVPAVVFAWVFELTPDGLKRDEEVAPGQSIAPQTAQRMNRLILALLLLALAYFGIDRFVLTPKRDAAGVARAAIAPAAERSESTRANAQSIAVLPFTNLSSDPEQAYFSDGLSEDLITALSQAGGLKVISRNSSFRFRDTKQSPGAIGQALGVARLLSGSVRRAGGQVRISAELTDVADGRTLWSKKYDRAYADLFALQDEITAEVARELQARLLATQADGAAMQSDRPPSGNLDAYNAYLQGRFHYDRHNPVDFEKSIDYYRRAIALDPGYAQAHAALGTSLGRHASVYLGGEPARKAMTEAQAEIHEALRLAPDLAYARAAYGNMLINGALRWADGVAELRAAARMAPNSSDVAAELAQAVASLGDLDEAVTLSRRVLQRDPLTGSTWYWLSIVLTAQGKYDEAEQAARRLIDLQPQADTAVAQLAYVLDRRGRKADALAAARAMRPGIYREMALAIVSQKAGDPAAADAALQALIANQSENAAYQIAQAQGARGDADQVFAWLERAWQNRDPGLRRVLYDPYLAPFRDDPRYAAFVTKIGLRKA